MTFNHIPIKTPVIETAHNSMGHFYSIGGERYPSITTILHSFPNEGIEIWKRKTPNWKDIQKESLDIGTELHHKIELYLKNMDNDDVISNRSLELFYNLRPELDKINNIQCLETYLYEPNLKIAGCTDCIAEYNGEKCIIDFKNSRRPKRDQYIIDYKLQVTAYSQMFRYCTLQKIDLGVIMIANWDNTTSIFKVNIPDYEDQLLEVLEQYEEL